MTWQHSPSWFGRLPYCPPIWRPADNELAAIFAFDVLQVDGLDYRQAPLIERKAVIKELLRGSKRVRCVQHIGEEGEAFSRRLIAWRLRYRCEARVVDLLCRPDKTVVEN